MVIALAMDDLALIRRWSAAVRAFGSDSAVLDPRTLMRDLPKGTESCLVDLGPRGRADLSGLAAAVAAHPSINFVALTAHPVAAEGLDVLRAGARGYCNRLASPAAGSAVLATVGDGEIWAGRQVTEHLLSRAPTPTSGAVGDTHFQMLTARESEIAALVAAGQSNKVIAADNGITERTVKVHLNNIFRKTGLRNRVQLALAFNRAEVSPPKLSNG
jgi:DNA-binding NarL/FixJ family response regulator